LNRISKCFELSWLSLVLILGSLIHTKNWNHTQPADCSIFWCTFIDIQFWWCERSISDHLWSSLISQFAWMKRQIGSSPLEYNLSSLDENEEAMISSSNDHKWHLLNPNVIKNIYKIFIIFYNKNCIFHIIIHAVLTCPYVI